MLKVTFDGIAVLYENFTFPGGEEHVVINRHGIPDHEIGKVVIEGSIKSSTEAFRLLLLVDAIRRIGRYSPKTELELVIPYFPYARQDRVCNPGESFSLGVFADVFNTFVKADKVTIHDPHSNVTPALIKNLFVLEQHTIIYKMLAWWIKMNDVVLVSPDAGAAKKTEALAKMFGGLQIVYANKKRDTKTGAILDIELMNHESIEGRVLLVVDDICDGGWTFTELAKKLKPSNPRSLNLFVTHGIFSKGLTDLSACYDKIFSSNVWWENITADGKPTELWSTLEKGSVK